MTGLSTEEILGLWERGKRQNPAERALSVLALALGDDFTGDLADLSIGERDARLLSVREHTFGDKLDAYVECPECGQSLEISLSTTLLSEPKAALSTSNESCEFEMDNLRVSVRPPNSHDLLRASHSDFDTARRGLLSGCVLKLKRDGEHVSLEELGERAIAEIERRITMLDPKAEILLQLQCPDCRHQWTALFDIAAFFWSEICTCAKRLMHEVHVLARAYGWSEGEILGLSAVRRNWYLERVT